MGRTFALRHISNLFFPVLLQRTYSTLPCAPQEKIQTAPKYGSPKLVDLGWLYE
jgi:hypothetical protein